MEGRHVLSPREPKERVTRGSRVVPLPVIPMKPARK